VKVKRKISHTHLFHSKSEPKPFRSGFSLLELLVVIAIIALLLSILMPALGKARSGAMQLKCTHNLKQINLAMYLYLHENNQTYPCAQDPLFQGYWLWMGRWRSFVECYLGGKITEDNPSVLICPQDTTYKQDYEAFSYAYSMTFYHSPEQINEMNSVEDTYLILRPSIPQCSSNVARPSGKIFIGEWFSNHSPIPNDQGWWCWQGRRNYLFADGSVSYIEAEQIRPARDRLPDANLTIDGIKGTDWPR